MASAVEPVATDPLLNQGYSVKELPNKTPSSPRREQKVSLSEFHTERSISISGEHHSDQRAPVIQHSSDMSDKHLNGQHVHASVVVNNEQDNKNRSTSKPPQTSTPIRSDASASSLGVAIDSLTGAVGFSPVRRFHAGSTVSTGSSVGSVGERPSRRTKRVSFVDPLDLRVPLLGFEVMEQRAKFTVFKLHVHKGKTDNWFVFRRYTDFVQLQQKLKRLFPMFRLVLPPKRWFRDNYEREFLDDRAHGLQAFIDSVLCHSDLCNCVPVQEFFCLGDPPGPHDSVEESRAYCEELEDMVYSLRKQVHDRDTDLELLRDELALYRSQVEILSKALREANKSGAVANDPQALTASTSSNSLAECDFTAPEADQSGAVLQNRPTNKNSHSMRSSQSGLSIKQEIDDVTGGSYSKGSLNLKSEAHGTKGSTMTKQQPSSSSIN